MRYLITFSYDGTNFSGYQKQPNKRTVQEEIESVLSRINNKNVSISSTGRTDAKVHALNQKAHFDLDKNWDLNRLKHSLNMLLPSDIYIKNIKKVDNDFHARFNVKKKIYVYKINLGEYNPIDRNYIYQYNKDLNIDKITMACKYFIGEHDFTSFTKLDEPKNCIRNIFDLNITFENNLLMIKFEGNGFLRYMVRNIVGTLLAVGEGKIEPQEIKTIIEHKNRQEAFLTAPPEGLYLYDVYY